MKTNNMQKCKLMEINDFSSWLVDQLKTNDLTQADLSRLSGLSRTAISNIINNKRLNPDQSTLNAIASALKLPPDTVYRAAGLLPPLPERRVAEEIAQYKLSELNDQELDEVLQFIEFIQDRQERNLRIKKTREGSSPPEVVKTQI